MKTASIWKRATASIGVVALSVGVFSALNTSAALGNELPKNVVQDINWSAAAAAATDYWPLNQELGLEPAQKVARVSLADPIDIFGLDYEGYFVDGEGRTVLRLVYNEKSSAVSGVWHEAIFKFGAGLYELIDFDKSYATYQNDAANPVKFLSSTQEREKTLRIDDLVGGKRTQVKSNIPINIVLQEGKTFADLGNVNHYVQMRITGDAFKRIYATAPGKTSLDYSTYTRSTVIPAGDHIDQYFRRGNKPTDSMIVSQRSFMSEFIANPVQYSPESNLGILRTEYQWEHASMAAANQYDPRGKDTGKGRPFGYLQAFDATLVDALKEDPSGYVGYTQLLNQDRTEYKGSSAYPYVRYGVKKSDINYSPDNKIAYVIFAEDNFQRDGEKIIQIEQMDGSIYEGTANFTGLDFVVDKEKFVDVFESKGESQVRYSVLSGWVDSNPVGTLYYEMTYDEEVTLPANTSLFVDTITKPQGGSIAFQFGDPNSALIRRQVGSYIGNASISNFDGIDTFDAYGGDGSLFKGVVREGATIKPGESLRIYLPNTADHEDQIFFVETDNATVWNGGGATLELEKNRNVKFHLGNRPKSATVTFTQKGQTDPVTAEITKAVVYKVANNYGGTLNITNAANLPSAGDFWLDHNKLEPGKEITVKTVLTDGTEYTSVLTYRAIDKVGTEKPLVFSDNSAVLDSVVVEKSQYVPHQEIFTNDYAEGTDDFYVDPRVAPADADKFNTNTTKVEGFVRYDGGQVRMRYIPPTGDVLVGAAQAAVNVFDDNGNLKTDASKLITVDGEEWQVYPYSLDVTTLKHVTELDDTAVAGAYSLLDVPGNGALVKDMRLIFNASNGSALPSDWKDTRVRTRVFFNPTLGMLAAEDGTGVKIVPDNEKYYGEDGYTANGFANGVAGTGDAFAADPTAPAGKTFLGWVTKAGLDKLGVADTYVTTAEEFAALTADTEVFTENTPVSSHLVAYAVYSEETLITFNANGGTFDGGQTEVKDDVADGVDAPANPTLEGKQFLGWASTPDATAPEEGILENVTAAKSVYAVWGEEEADTDAPAAPVVKANDNGSVTVTPPTDPDTAKVDVTFTPEGEGAAPVTVTASKDADGNWTLPADAPNGVTVDKATGKITIPADKVKDDSEVTAIATDQADNPSEQGRDVAGAALSAATKAATVIEGKAVSAGTTVVTPSKAGATITTAGAVNGLNVDTNGNLTGTPVITDWEATEDTRDVELSVTATLGDESVTESVKVTVQRDTDGDGIPDLIDDDDDNDGVKDTDEATKGTDPKGFDPVVSDVPVITTVNVLPSVEAYKNKIENLPEGSQVTIKTQPEVPGPGLTEAFVEITLPNGDKVDAVIPVTVVDDDKTGPVVNAGETDTVPATGKPVVIDDKVDDPADVATTKVVDEKGQPIEGAVVTVDPDKGTVTVSVPEGTDPQDAKVVFTDKAGNDTESPIKIAEPDKTGPDTPTVKGNEDGSVVVTPPTDADTAKVEVTFTPEGSDIPVTLVVTKGENGWTIAEPTPSPEGVTVDSATGKITIPADKVKDGTPVTATASDESGNPSGEGKVTAGTALSVGTKTATVVEKKAVSAGNTVVTPSKAGATITAGDDVNGLSVDANGNLTGTPVVTWAADQEELVVEIPVTVALDGETATAKVEVTIQRDTDGDGKPDVTDDDDDNDGVKDTDEATQGTDPKGFDPEVSDDAVETVIGAMPTVDDYKDKIENLPEGSKVTVKTEPDVSKPGKSEAVVEITLPNGETVEVTIPVEINDVAAPVVDPIKDVTAEVGTAITDIPVNVDDDEATVEITGLPDGLTYDPATGAITGTPTKAGTYEVTITVTNADGKSSVEKFTITIADQSGSQSTGSEDGEDTVDLPATGASVAWLAALAALLAGAGAFLARRKHNA